MKHYRQLLKDQRGASVILVAILLVPILGFLAFAIDIGLRVVTKNELKNVADAAVLAGARQLGEIYVRPVNPPGLNDELTAEDIESVKQVALNAAFANKAAGVSIIIDTNDLKLGHWDPDPTVKPRFSDLSLIAPKAVQVTARRDTIKNTPVPTFIAKIIGTSFMSISATSTAALSGANTGTPGLPITLADDYFTLNDCTDPITFFPTPNSCTGWTTFSDKANANTLKGKNGILPCLQTGSPSSCYTTGHADGVAVAGDDLNLLGGTVEPAFDEFKALFEIMRLKNDGIIDADQSDDTWTTEIPIIKGWCGDNPNKTGELLGFTTITISAMDPSSTGNTITATIQCGEIHPGRSGGNKTSTAIGNIPGLVE